MSCVLNAEFINRKIVRPTDKLPSNIVYATFTNMDRCAINDGIFREFVKSTHSKDLLAPLPSHTIIVKASDLKLRVEKTQRYRNMPALQENLLYTGCCDAHVQATSGISAGGGSKSSLRVDPMLKLYVGRPVMINKNIDVEKSIANGAMCTFKSVVLKNGYEDCDVLNIDGYYVRCVSADKVQFIEVVLQEGDTRKILKLEAESTSALASFPCPGPFDSEITSSTPRRKKKIQLTQFPFNIANARTVHKLQGRSIENLLVSTWSYTTNWVYVVLSRVRTSNGLFVRVPLLHTKTSSPATITDAERNQEFHSFCRREKNPKFLDYV